MDLKVNASVTDIRPLGTGATTGNSAGHVAQTATPAVGQTDQSELKTAAQAVSHLQDFMSVTHRNLNFSVDETTGIQVVKVVASDTGEVIRQMPTEVALKLAQSLKDGDTSLFDGWA